MGQRFQRKALSIICNIQFID
ncbi:hypothetical protein BOS5A_211299 [Bosea sp. EC-HK365B]|nr:hypothetical protein BOSE7B_90300 [Bosea sp. 7B]VVT60508.1 hypothetical protein BOS5A_211299 [Bosea sp. EC-HK365B]VXB64455.1 hypothetical protein BOSE127_140241 [Bosea sp. 127]